MSQAQSNGPTQVLGRLDHGKRSTLWHCFFAGKLHLYPSTMADQPTLQTVQKMIKTGLIKEVHDHQLITSNHSHVWAGSNQRDKEFEGIRVCPVCWGSRSGACETITELLAYATGSDTVSKTAQTPQANQTLLAPQPPLKKYVILTSAGSLWGQANEVGAAKQLAAELASLHPETAVFYVARILGAAKRGKVPILWEGTNGHRKR